MSKNNDKMNVTLKDAFKKLNQLNPYSSILSENAISVVKNYIDTGSMALNAIVSGSLYGGVPEGRIIGLVGPSGSGKTLILNKIIGNKQRTDPEAWGVIWDSEHAYDPIMARNVGANPDKIKVNPAGSVEECRNEIVNFLDIIEKDKSLYGKVIIGIDSLANLPSQKELNDAEKGKDAVDMGMRAKAIKSMLRVLTKKCGITNTTLIFTNHIYDDPTSMFPSLIKNQPGGKGTVYLPSVVIQLAVTQDKIEQNDKPETYSPLANKVKGVNMRALTAKNRIVPEMQQTSLSLNYTTGLYKYSGLLEMAEGYNVVKKEGNTYFLTKDNTKLGMKNAFKNNTEIWDKYILPELELALTKYLKYSDESKRISDETDLLIQSIDEIDSDIDSDE